MREHELGILILDKTVNPTKMVRYALLFNDDIVIVAYHITNYSFIFIRTLFPFCIDTPFINNNDPIYLVLLYVLRFHLSSGARCECEEILIFFQL